MAKASLAWVCLILVVPLAPAAPDYDDEVVAPMCVGGRYNPDALTNFCLAVFGWEGDFLVPSARVEPNQVGAYCIIGDYCVPIYDPSIEGDQAGIPYDYGVWVFFAWDVSGICDLHELTRDNPACEFNENKEYWPR
ncbi:MAG: hypothetical protein ACPGQL_07005 [Thermoplasmatota archaeon]